MKVVEVICPSCGVTVRYKNWFHWVWKCPFHWFGKRRDTCVFCGNRSYMRRVK